MWSMLLCLCFLLLTPRSPAFQSNADSVGDEPTGLVHHLPRRMLAAGGEVTMAEDQSDNAEEPERDGVNVRPPSKETSKRGISDAAKADAAALRINDS